MHILLEEHIFGSLILCWNQYRRFFIS